MTPNATADASLSVLDTRRGRQLCLMGALLTALLGVMLMLRDAAEISGSGLSCVSVDFYVFWAAAKLALQGLPLDAFDVDRIREIANVTQEGWMPWAYPPGFLLLVTPLGRALGLRCGRGRT